MKICKCIWKKEENCWSTDCGNKFVVNDGSPGENGMVYCPFCARVIYVRRGKTEKGGGQDENRRKDNQKNSITG